MSPSERNETSPWHDLTARLVLRAREAGHQVCYLVTSCGAAEGKSTVCRGVAGMAAASGTSIGILEINSHATTAYPSMAGIDAPLAAEPDAALGYSVWRLPEDFSSIPTFADEPRQWATGVDIMLIDAPPIGSFMQQRLSPFSDGVILVADTRKRRMAQLVRAARTVTDGGGKLIGTVLNLHESPLPRWLDKWGDRP